MALSTNTQLTIYKGWKADRRDNNGERKKITNALRNA